MAVNEGELVAVDAYVPAYGPILATFRSKVKFGAAVKVVPSMDQLPVHTFPFRARRNTKGAFASEICVLINGVAVVPVTPRANNSGPVVPLYRTSKRRKSPLSCSTRMPSS